jgi:predicted nucleotidyltransferase
VSEATDSQRALVERLREVLAGDARVESAWLSGSFGRGVGDAWSDIDVLAVVEEEDIAACLAEYGGLRNPVGETVLMMRLYGRIVSAVRPDWERYDIVFITPKELRARDKADLRPLAVESLDAPASPTPPGLYQPAPDALLDMAREFLRVLGLLPTAIERQEWLSGQEGVGLLRRGLVEMMIEANGVGRAQRGGAKRLNPYLTPEQRAAVERLPQPGADRESLMIANAALAAIFLPLAKETLAKAGAPWPKALEDATRAHLARVLGLAI